MDNLLDNNLGPWLIKKEKKKEIAGWLCKVNHCVQILSKACVSHVI